MITEHVTVDVAAGIATYAGEEVEVAIAILTHVETGDTIWESPIAVPFQVEDWLTRVMGHMSTVRLSMENHWPEVAPYVCWWLIEPGEDENNPYGLEV